MNRQKLNRLNKLAEKIGNGNQEETNQAFEEMMGIYKNEIRLIIAFGRSGKIIPLTGMILFRLRH